MTNRIKQLLSRTPLGPMLRRQHAKRVIEQWDRDGRPTPPPHEIKQQAVLDLAHRAHTHTLIETGTFYGEMIEAMRRHFRRLYSIEIQPELATKAQQRFAKYPHITVLQGDSATALAQVVKTLSEPCLFWLDGHYSGGVTGRGVLDSPIAQELSTIFAHPVRDHVVLIDDARCFNGTEGYPTLEELRSLVKQERPEWAFEVKDDIIRCGPAVIRST